MCARGSYAPGPGAPRVAPLLTDRPPQPEPGGTQRHDDVCKCLCQCVDDEGAKRGAFQHQHVTC